jgi:hypothetical protein
MALAPEIIEIPSPDGASPGTSSAPGRGRIGGPP